MVERNKKIEKLLSFPGGAQQPPGLVASAAKMVPFTFLSIIIVGILAFGIVDRGPWTGPDTTGTALIKFCLSAFKQNSPLACFFPNLYGVKLENEAPLFFFISAYIISAAEQAYLLIFGDSLPLEYIDDFGRILQVLCVLVALIFLWLGTKILGLRRESRPSDPLGIGPDASTFGNNLGTCAVLLTLSCLGLVSQWHEVGSEGFSFLFQAVCFFAMCQSPEKPKESAVIFSVGLVGLFFGTSLHVALSILLAAIFIFSFVYPWTLVKKKFLRLTFYFLTSTILFVVLVYQSDESQNFYLWINGQLELFELRPFYVIKNWLWTWWPLWPICLVMLYNLVKVEKFNQPHLKFLGILLLTQSFFPLMGLLTNDGQKFVPIVPLTVMAAFGLLFLPKIVADLLDWFALSLFTFLGFVVWFYWIALHSGLPVEVFANITRAAPGISKVVNTNDLILGVIISLFWIYLILWRLKFIHPNIWRPVVLSAGGLGLTWALLITLWGPALNINRGYQNIQALLESFPKETICIHRDDKKLIAIVAAHSETKIVPFDRNLNKNLCRYLLVRGNSTYASVEKQTWIKLSDTYRKSDSKNREPFTMYFRN